MNKQFIISSVKVIQLNNFLGVDFLIECKVSKVGDCSRGRPEGSLFNSYYTEV